MLSCEQTFYDSGDTRESPTEGTAATDVSEAGSEHTALLTGKKWALQRARLSRLCNAKLRPQHLTLWKHLLPASEICSLHRCNLRYRPSHTGFSFCARCVQPSISAISVCRVVLLLLIELGSQSSCPKS